MKVIQYSRAAKADIAKIWRYLAENWGTIQASRYARELQDAACGLADGKRIGSRTSAQDGMYKARCGAHMIYYRENLDQIDIIRILHGKQDVDRHL